MKQPRKTKTSTVKQAIFYNSLFQLTSLRQNILERRFARCTSGYFVWDWWAGNKELWWKPSQDRLKVIFEKQYFSWSGYKVTRISATAKFAMPIKSGTTHRSSICFQHSLKNFDHEASGDAHRAGLHTEEMQGAQPRQDCLSHHRFSLVQALALVDNSCPSMAEITRLDYYCTRAMVVIVPAHSPVTASVRKCVCNYDRKVWLG